MASTPSIRLGTRSSALARWQAEWVAARLAEHGATVTLVPITTRGDRNHAQPVDAIGGDGIFTKELQRALLADEIDLAVHSLKDLPTEVVPGLCLAAVPERGPTSDVLVARDGRPLADLPMAAAIGTGSLRRRTQLWHVRPDLLMRDIRGNVDTRLAKLADGQFDALVLAEAGLRRLGLADRITEILPEAVLLPAVGQGALGIECRQQDAATKAALVRIDDPATHAAVVAERALLRALSGGCLAPVGGRGRIDSGGRLELAAVVLSADGRTRLAAQATAPPAEAAELGQRVAADLLAQGAAELIQAARAETRS